MSKLVTVISNILINPLLALLFAGGLLVFVFGVLEFFWDLNISGAHDKEKGKQHMLWGIIGMFIMASAYGILQVIASTVGQRLP